MTSNKRISRLAFKAGCVLIGSCLAGSLAGQTDNANPATIVTFDPPGSAQTFPEGINSSGVIAGYYYDGVGQYYSFLREPNGTFVIFDVPGAIGTYARSINDNGAVAGYYQTATYPYPQYGFVRGPDGTIATFNAPGATNTFPYGIDNNGTAAGSYWDVNGASHGFLRNAGGELIAFDVPGAGTTSGEGTVAVDINVAGAVIGYDTGSKSYAFLRVYSGQIVPIDVSGCSVTLPTGINGSGTVTGICAVDGLNSGFVRALSGESTIYSIPGANVFSAVINISGTVAGFYAVGNQPDHGYWRSAGGTIHSFDPPGSIDTYPAAINNSGTITGSYDDASYGTHGFLISPS
jgi:hypothetical protein